MNNAWTWFKSLTWPLKVGTSVGVLILLLLSVTMFDVAWSHWRDKQSAERMAEYEKNQSELEIKNAELEGEKLQNQKIIDQQSQAILAANQQIAELNREAGELDAKIAKDRGTLHKVRRGADPDPITSTPELDRRLRALYPIASGSPDVDSGDPDQ